MVTLPLGRRAVLSQALNSSATSRYMASHPGWWPTTSSMPAKTFARIRTEISCFESSKICPLLVSRFYKGDSDCWTVLGRIVQCPKAWIPFAEEVRFIQVVLPFSPRPTLFRHQSRRLFIASMLCLEFVQETLETIDRISKGVNDCKKPEFICEGQATLKRRNRTGITHEYTLLPPLKYHRLCPAERQNDHRTLPWCPVGLVRASNGVEFSQIGKGHSRKCGRS